MKLKLSVRLIFNEVLDIIKHSDSRTIMKTKQIELMGHIIAGYPSIQACLQAGSGILKGGANFLEVQFPFSDGNADGNLIQDASDYSIKHGFTTKQGFTIIEKLAENTSRHILAMTYANIIFKYGIKDFIKRLKESGAYGLIAPDFVYGENDLGLREECLKHEIYFIELIAPFSKDSRIKEIASNTHSPFVYVVARSGLTGSSTEINDGLLAYIENVSKICAMEGKKIMVGFGINHKNQISALLGKVYGVVVGSHFVNIINENLDSNNLVPILSQSAKELLQGADNEA